ncbi:helix-turn-helix domain-containing protein [Floccifex sp.]|uniref:helix-turn-helix domain-containing protein n=1 Tax=Floccifex sp. TaxID=2815810 RepID=UPI003F0247C5
MKIGQALRTERLRLGLSQQEMCAGIISRPHYAKVEKGMYMINSENLFQILLKNKIDITAFYKLIQNTYNSQENKIDNQLQIKMDHAVNTKNVNEIEEYAEEIISTSKNEILKLRAIVTVAYFKGDVDKLSTQVRKEIKKEFDEGRHWTKRPESLRLFANTMPLWAQDELDFFIGRLLITAEKEDFSELMLERYLRIFANYLAMCYERKISEEKGCINEVIKYIILKATSFHLMIYKTTGIYMHLLFNGNKEEAQKIREDMKKCGYENLISSWPE